MFCLPTTQFLVITWKKPVIIVSILATDLFTRDQTFYQVNESKAYVPSSAE